MMTDDGREWPKGNWGVRLTLEPQATDAPALQWAIFPEDPTSRFRADLRFLEAHRQATETANISAKPDYLGACWNRLFRTITGDRVYLLTSAAETAFTTNEPGGHKWVATKAVRSGAAGFCWCIPIDVPSGQVLQIRLDSQNRVTLSDLAEKHRAPNKELKLTKPSILELRSLTPVLGNFSWGGCVAIELLAICEWVGRSMQATELEQPQWEAVEAAIRALDNASRNDLYLIPDKSDSETYLSIGGGAGRYIVTGSIKNEEFPTVIDPAKVAEPAQVLVVGGQSGHYPGNWILDLNTALRAARAFYATGRFEGEVTWARA